MANIQVCLNCEWEQPEDNALPVNVCPDCGATDSLCVTEIIGDAWGHSVTIRSLFDCDVFPDEAILTDAFIQVSDRRFVRSSADGVVSFCLADGKARYRIVKRDSLNMLVYCQRIEEEL